MAGNAWTEEETKMAFALYWILSPKDYRATCNEVIQLADSIGRSANAVKMKIENLKRGDPNRKALGQTGLPNGATLELDLWNQFGEEGDSFLDECLSLLSKQISDENRTQRIEYALVEFIPEGAERVTRRVERVNQNYFRSNLIINYEGRCCISGLSEQGLLVASHIKPWSVADPKTERLASSNGLLLNALHDKAFDRGLITLDADYQIVVSSRLNGEDEASRWIRSFAGATIRMPITAPPAKEFIEYHNDVVFVA